jgi:HAMP domain-containing protein
VGDGKYVIGYDLTSIAPQFMHDALDGITGGQLVIGSVGDAVVNSYRPLGVKGLNWAVLARVTATEAFSPSQFGAEKDFLSSYRDAYGYYDIFLIEPNGLIFYTVAHEADYRTNILTGEYKDTNLGLLVAETMKNKSLGFTDFAHYAPSGGEPAAFFAVPILNENGEIDMVLAVQASLEQLSAIMEESTGLGETGETYIIGSDQLRRTETRFLADLGVDSTVLNPQFKVENIAADSVLAGQSGQDTFADSDGVPVLSVWSPLSLKQFNTSGSESQLWGVIAQVDETEALAPVTRLAGGIAVVIGLAVLVIGVLAVAISARFATRFVRPILNLTETATQMAAGNMDLAVKVENNDEIGILSRAFNSMTSQLRDLIGGLESRVAARTKDLATVARISTSTATILDPEQMLATAVHLTQRGFGLYHAHVFTYEKEEEHLQIVACGYKEGDEHEGTHGTTVIPLQQEQSLVARAARTRKPVIVNDVHSEPGWLPNPLLPETNSELAVPMVVGDQLLGVLDVQSDKLNAFTEEDANIQMTLAAQIATALKNAQSFTEAKSRADLETMVNNIGQKIQRATTVEDTLQIAVRELGTAIGASRVKVNIGANTRQNGGEGTNSN